MSKSTFSSAADAEAAFYDALARADLEAMMAVWSEDEEVVCVHPGGPRVVGLAAVREAWRQVFASGTQLAVSTSHHVVSANTLLTVHNVLEHVADPNVRQTVTPIVATNVYARGARGWRMVMHHAAPTPEPGPADSLLTPRVVH